MEPFEYQGKKLEVWTNSGTVLSSSKHSRTSVSSHGGGGWVGPNGGTVSAPTLVSSTTTEQEIWLRRDQGGETAIKLFDVDVPVREGQRVTFIAARQPDAKEGFWVTLVNHSANRHWRLSSNVEMSARGKLGAYPLLKWYDFLVAFLIGRLVIPTAWPLLATILGRNEDALMAGTGLLFCVPVAYIVWRVILRAKRKNRMFAALDAWTDRNAQALFSTEKAASARPVETEKVA